MQQLFSTKDREDIIRMFGARAPQVPATNPLARMHLMLDCVEMVHAQNQQNRVTEAVNLADPDFKGYAYEKPIDQKPLTKQMLRIFAYVQDEQWHTLADITEKTGAPEASVSAALRALTTKAWGSHAKIRERIPGTRLWRYKIMPNRESLTWQKYVEARDAGNIPS